MKIVMLGILGAILSVGCNKKEPPAAKKVISTVMAKKNDCGEQIILATPMKIAGSQIELPVATKICFTKDSSEITIHLPKGFSYAIEGADAVSERGAPVLYATYHCICGGGGACQVMYADGMGFGCLHNNCMGGCTGQFIYKGYTVNRVINLSETKEKFFAGSDIQQAVKELYEARSVTEPFSKETLYGVNFYIVRDERVFLAKASCDCEGTKACTLKVKDLQLAKTTTAFKIYYCEGPCNGCELTVNE